MTRYTQPTGDQTVEKTEGKNPRSRTARERTNSSQDAARMRNGEDDAAKYLASLDREVTDQTRRRAEVERDAAKSHPVPYGGLLITTGKRVPYRSTEKRTASTKPKTG